MKKQILITAFAFTGVNAMAQTFDYLETNKIKVRINSGGNLFLDISGGPEFEAPKNSGNNIMVFGNLWIGGEDMSSATHLSANMGDFEYGPLLPGVATCSTMPSLWNKVWKVTDSDISTHLANYTSSGYVPASAIADWPAHGNASYGEPNYVAPFVDVDLDGTYNPLMGDYPQIKGTQCIYQVYNDNKVHASGGAQLGVQIQCMAYVFDCADDSALSNTVFVNYTVVNHSASTYYNTYMGFFSDPDLGNYADDYIGCDVSRGLTYAFNGDPFDDAVGSHPGYDSLLPMQGTLYLGGIYADADTMDNPITTNYADAVDSGGIVYPALGLGYESGIQDDERINLSSFHPVNSMASVAQYYNQLKGLTASGSLWMHSTSTVTPTDFSFIYDSDPYYLATYGVPVPANDREDLVGNVPGDRRNLGSMGGITLEPGEYNQIDLAFIFATDYTAYNDPLAAFSLLKERADTIRAYFNNGITPCGTFTFNNVVEIKSEEISFNLYPNPATNSITITLPKAEENMNYALYDVMGNAIISGEIKGNAVKVDISGISNGVYLVEVSNETIKSTKRLIVSR